MRIRSLVVDAAILALIGSGGAVYGCTRVTGDSMAPALRRGDVVVFERGHRAVARGSIVVLGEGRHAFVHRVVSVDSGMIATRGDANPIADREPTSTASVRGRVVVVIPSGGLFRRLAASGGRARLWSQSHTQR